MIFGLYPIRMDSSLIESKYEVPGGVLRAVMRDDHTRPEEKIASLMAGCAEVCKAQQISKICRARRQS